MTDERMEKIAIQTAEFVKEKAEDLTLEDYADLLSTVMDELGERQQDIFSTIEHQRFTDE